MDFFINISFVHQQTVSTSPVSEEDDSSDKEVSLNKEYEVEE